MMMLKLCLGCIVSSLLSQTVTSLLLPAKTYTPFGGRTAVKIIDHFDPQKVPTATASLWTRLFMKQSVDTTSPPPGRVANVTEWLRLSSTSLQKYTGKSLLEHMMEDDDSSVQSLEDAHDNERFAILSHGVQEDPIYNYFNRAALETFQYEPEEIYQLPSRKSAPSNLRVDRAALIQASVERGFQVYTEAVRVTKYGQLFEINEGLLWNVYDDEGNRVGQTALFDRNKIIKLESSG